MSEMVHELGPTVIELAALPSYKGFLLILIIQHLYLLFQLVSSFKKCPFGLETACFNSLLWCGIWHTEISVL